MGLISSIFDFFTGGQRPSSKPAKAPANKTPAKKIPAKKETKVRATPKVSIEQATKASNACPKCGKLLGAGVTRCWSSGCDYIVSKTVKVSDVISITEPSSSEEAQSAFVTQENPIQTDREYSTKPRPAYIAQVGLDFGTAFSKCVVRDIGSGTARVLENSSLDGSPFLFRSVIGFRDQILFLNPPDEDEGLPFAKMLLTALARRHPAGGALLLWRDYLSCLPSGMSEIEGVTLAAAWLLASILRSARALAGQMMPGFGAQSDDYFFVNLCVPVDDMQEHNVIVAFRNALDLAWRMSESDDLPSRATLAQLRSFVASLPHTSVDGFSDLYPEVGANVQAFLKSGFARGHWGIPFFMTDVGAGTVDQSFFILSPDLGRLTFLSAMVRPLGSSEIDTRCVAEFYNTDSGTYQARLAEVRAHKEGRARLPRTLEKQFSEAIGSLHEEVTHMSQQCINAGLYARNQEEKLKPTQFKDSVVMNAGGGMRDEPYRNGVLSSFNKHWRMRPDMIELPKPNDLLTAAGRALPDDWFRRLTVAYGLSFQKHDLHQITLPDAVLPLSKISDQSSSNVDQGHIPGRCRSCGKMAIPGDDYCYNCSG